LFLLLVAVAEEKEQDQCQACSVSRITGIDDK